jgi:EpsI family protein
MNLHSLFDSFNRANLYRYTLASILILLLLVNHHSTANRVVRGWLSFESVHTLVFLAIGLYLLWRRRGELRRLDLQPALGIGSGLTLAGCLALLAGKLASIAILQDISLPVTVLGIVTLVYGLECVRIVWFPMFYMLLFMFGLAERLLGGVSIYLQKAAALIAFTALNLAGMPVLLHNQYLQLPHITLEVAQGCSGVHHIIVLLAIALPVIFIDHQKWSIRWLLAAVALLIGITANGLRIATIGMWTASHPNYVHGPGDIFYVSSILVVGLISFLLVNRFAGRYSKGKSVGNSSSAAPYVKKDNRKERDIRPLALSIGTGILCCTCVGLQWFEPQTVTLAKPLTALPLEVGGWIGRDLSPMRSPLHDSGADSLLYRAFQRADGGAEVKISIAYFENQNEEKKIVSYRTGWLFEGAKTVPVTTKPSERPVGPYALYDDPVRGRGYVWYDINGSLMTDPLAVKKKMVIDLVKSRTNNGAIVLLSFSEASPTNGKYAKEFMKEFAPVVSSFLRRTQVVTSNVDGVT